jgi:8-oxo-dGTP pyrophosphatase MutT (NUDIX family)
MKERLRQFLALRQKRQIVDSEHTPSAVVLPLFYKNGEHWVLFIKRTVTVEHHKGQISFPGGRREPEDHSLLDTALRELNEEIGVPSTAVEILGELDDSITLTSNYIISTFVGVIPYPYKYILDPKEIAYLIEIPISALLK